MSNQKNLLSDFFHFFPAEDIRYREKSQRDSPKSLSKPSAGLIPFDLLTSFQKGAGFYYKGKEFITYSTLDLQESAFFRVSARQKVFFFFLVTSLALGLFFQWHTTLIIVLAILTGLYFCDLLFNLFLIYKSFSDTAEIVVEQKELLQQTNRNWEKYTILCPLYKEATVIGQFVHAIQQIDYPKEKLQVIMLLEEDDQETIEQAYARDLPPYFKIAVIPHSAPKTKPKAINFGLKYATGNFIVVYDAEDIPEPDQLKKIVLAFEKASKQTICIQAKLNFYNPYQNLLTRIFTAEYSLWFDLILTGLQSIGAPIPLGGTSNHFRTNDLRNLNGWDAFNVTEDCDLGIRLAKRGYYTAMVNATTFEEANSQIPNWFRQRGRWIKGYIQTYLVHTRNIQTFFTLRKKSHIVTFQLVVGGKILSLFINPFMWAITITYFLFRARFGTFIESFFPTPILYMGVISLVFGNFLYLYYYMIGAAKRKQLRIIKYAFFVPLYWLAMSVTAWYALYKIIREPYYWAKTKHGLHLKKIKPIHKKIPPAYLPKISFAV